MSYQNLDLMPRTIDGQVIRPERFGRERGEELFSLCKSCAKGPWSDNLSRVMTLGERAFVRCVWDCLSGDSSFAEAFLAIRNGEVDAYLDATPAKIETRSGKRARLSEKPGWCEYNQAWLVIYDLGDWRFSLYWPSLTYFPPNNGKPAAPHNLDAKL